MSTRSRKRRPLKEVEEEEEDKHSSEGKRARRPQEGPGRGGQAVSVLDVLHEQAEGGRREAARREGDEQAGCEGEPLEEPQQSEGASCSIDGQRQ